MPARFESNSVQTLSGMRFTVRMGRRPRLSKLVISSVSWRLFEGRESATKRHKIHKKPWCVLCLFVAGSPAKRGEYNIVMEQIGRVLIVMGVVLALVGFVLAL